jgi:hypothetical protein
MWTWLASLIGGPVISGLINAYKAKLEAANTQDHIAADLAAKEIEAEIAARKEASAIIIAEQGRWYTAIIRPLLAFLIIIYFWKVIVWDKVLGLGSTDPITGMIADWTGSRHMSAAGRSRRSRGSSGANSHRQQHVLRAGAHTPQREGLLRRLRG